MPRLPGPEDLGRRPAPSAGTGIAQYRGSVPGADATGRAVMGFGQTLSAVGDEIWREQQRIDTIKAEEAFNRLRSIQTDLSIGKGGFANLKGGDAVQPTYFPSYMDQFTRATGEITNKLENDNQKELFKRRAAVAGVEFKGNLISHAVRQGDEMARMTAQSTIDTEIANIAANPLDGNKVAFSNLRISDTLNAENRRLGIANDSPDAIKRAKKVQDDALQKRIEALLFDKPLQAEALFRSHQNQITDPALRRQLQNQVREVAISARATIEAQSVIDETRSQVNQKTLFPRETGKASISFDGAVDSLISREGGYNRKDGKSGMPVNFGINQRANPDIDVAKLTKERAKEIYRERYWNAIGGDKLAPATAVVALDAAALQGPGVAKQLIEDSNGDPDIMIQMRRKQLIALATADPEQRPYLEGWLKRLDGLAAQISGMGREAYHPDDPTAQNTSGLPNSRDLAAQLPVMEGKVETRATELYGPDQANPDRMAFAKRMKAEIKAKIADDVQQLNAIQRQAQGTLIDAILGPGIGTDAQNGMVAAGGQNMKPVTSFSQIQADPNLMRAWQMLDPSAKPPLLNLMKKELDTAGSGDVVLFRELFNRVHLEPGDPLKIDYYKQITDPAVADRLSMQQIQTLRLEIDRNETPGGRSVNQMRKVADANVAMYFRTNIMFTAQPERQIAATMRWNEDAAKKIDEYVAQKKDARTLFMLDTPDSIVSQKYLQTYVNSTPAQGLAQEADRVRQTAVEEFMQPGETLVILNPETADDQWKALPPGAPYRDPGGNLRRKASPTQNTGQSVTGVIQRGR